MNSTVLFQRPMTIESSSLVDGSTQAAGERELRVTLACLDVAVSLEMPWHLAMYLHLFVPSAIVASTSCNATSNDDSSYERLSASTDAS
jgi:hypothetical protein